jgi:hypothetical protein
MMKNVQLTNGTYAEIEDVQSVMFILGELQRPSPSPSEIINKMWVYDYIIKKINYPATICTKFHQEAIQKAGQSEVFRLAQGMTRLSEIFTPEGELRETARNIISSSLDDTNKNPVALYHRLQKLV